MFAFVKGILEEIEDGSVVVDMNGFGINVKVAMGDNISFPEIGSEIKLYTYTCVREDAFLLYGFWSKYELAIFKKIISVSSIGPKNALDIFSIMSAEDFVFAVIGGDAKKIAKTPGIAIKKAERIVLELKDKLDAESAFASLANGNQEGVDSTANNVIKLNSTILLENEEANDAILALVQLGYSQTDAKTSVVNAVRDIGEHSSSDEYIKGALKYLF